MDRSEAFNLLALVVDEHEAAQFAVVETLRAVISDAGWVRACIRAGISLASL